MSDLDKAPSAPEPSGFFNRKFALICLTVSIAIAAWVVVKTELRVSDLQARGFSDAATGSVRDHAYLPLLGAYVGSFGFMLIAAAVKRLLRRRK